MLQRNLTLYACCQVLVDSGDTEKFCDAKKHFSIAGGSFPLVASSTSFLPDISGCEFH